MDRFEPKETPPVGGVGGFRSRPGSRGPTRRPKAGDERRSKDRQGEGDRRRVQGLTPSRAPDPWGSWRPTADGAMIPATSDGTR